MWCSLGHRRKFSKDGPSACRINGHINHMKLVMFLLNVKKETKAIVLMYFLPEVLFKKIKIALRIAFSWIVKKKNKKPHSALQFWDLLQETDLFFFLALPWHFTLIWTPNSTLSYTAVYKTWQKCSETNVQHNFFVFSSILVKVYIFWKEIWQRIQICHWFCCRR